MKKKPRATIPSRKSIFSVIPIEIDKERALSDLVGLATRLSVVCGYPRIASLQPKVNLGFNNIQGEFLHQL